MPAWQYDLEDLRQRMREGGEVFAEPIVRIEATYDNSRDVLAASITGMDTISWNSSGGRYTIIGEGMASLEDLDQGQDAFRVMVSTRPDRNLRWANTVSVKVFDEDGTVYEYGNRSSRVERITPL